MGHIVAVPHGYTIVDYICQKRGHLQIGKAVSDNEQAGTEYQSNKGTQAQKHLFHTFNLLSDSMRRQFEL